MKETWRPVIDFEDSFEVSSLGRIRTIARLVYFTSKLGNRHQRLKKSHIAATQEINSGYLIAHLSKDSVRKARTVHSVVAAAFIGPRPHRHDVCHENNNRKDNRAVNLRYDTRTNNHLDGIKHGTIYLRASAAKLNPEKALLIRESKDSAKALAKRYGVSVAAVNRVLRRASWKHI